MKPSDFILERVTARYGAYWFRVTGETKRELTERYMEQSMIEVPEVVFYIQDGQFSVKRVFPSYCDVIENPLDKELQSMLEKVTFKAYREMYTK